jgi:hypothetical protein
MRMDAVCCIYAVALKSYFPAVLHAPQGGEMLYALHHDTPQMHRSISLPIHRER